MTSLPEHEIKQRMQGAGGLAQMKYWWTCTCGWETARSVGSDGFQAVTVEAVDHAEDGHTDGDSLAAELAARRLVAEGKAENLADGYLAQIPDDAPIWASLARLLLSAERNLNARGESLTDTVTEAER